MSDVKGELKSMIKQIKPMDIAPESEHNITKVEASEIGEVMTWPIGDAVQYPAHLIPANPLYLPAKFPDINTDLKCPPTNWLRSHTKVEEYAKNFKWHKENTRTSSFSMAHKMPDLVGEHVDVISDSENIKQLLKMPFANCHLSMMVHRVGKTLLIDDFDIHKHLLRDQQEEWKWIFDFYKETVLENMHQKMKCVPRKDRSRDHLQMRNMLSKFLYYSIVDSEDSSLPEPAASLQRCNDDPIETHMPEPLPEILRDQCSREVLWEFQDIRMLIGTDLPIFQAGSQPCVSVRLREMRQPINVLTGLDCWLDNLMCNVPNLAMCYHINGLIQDYKLIKTEDIPKEDGGQFTPQVITDIARNILSFLKSNATKEGHTYWLYKETDDDVVKLYDLTTLCSDQMHDRSGNQFTVPLGMLLYRVARNMRENGSDNLGTICTLLKTSLLLLDPHKHAQVYTSATYLLADLYIPDNSLDDPSFFLSEKNDYETRQESDSDSDLISVRSVPVSELCLPQQPSALPLVTYRRLTGTLQSRCLEALNFAQKGLECLDDDVTHQLDTHTSTTPVSPSSTAIPLHLRPPPATTHLSELRLATAQRPQTWHFLSKVLLLRKASMAYYKLATRKIETSKYGAALRNARHALTCFDAMERLSPTKGTENRSILCDVLGVIGDARMFLARGNQQAKVYAEQYGANTEYDWVIKGSAEREISQSEYDWCTEGIGCLKQNLSTAVMCYERSIRLDDRPSAVASLTKRFGNGQNELGVFYMNEVLEMLVDTEEVENHKPSDALERKWKKSYECFDTALRAFCSIQDNVNQALVLSNMGRLMRICAQAFVQSTADVREFTPQERHFYQQAVEYYERAVTYLPKSTSSSPLRASIYWELSTTLYNMGELIQENPPLSLFTRDEIEKKVIECLTGSQDYCVKSDAACDDDATKRHLRLARINYKLASLHHKAYRDKGDVDRRRFMKQLAIGQYEKCVSLYQQTTAHGDCLRAQLELVALHEFCFSDQTGYMGRVKSLEAALDTIISCEDTLSKLSDYTQDAAKLLDIFESRLSFILLHLTKLYSSNKKAKQSRCLDAAKSMYSRVLKADTSSTMTVVARCELLKNVVADVRELWTLSHSKT